MPVWSPFARTVTKTLQFPGSELDTVTIQKLGWKALDAAAEENTRKGIVLAREIGPGGLLTEISKQGGEDAVRAQASANPMLQFDRGTLIERGVIAWTVTASGKPTADEIADLNADVAKWLATEIYELSRPRTEDEQKNG